MGSVLCSHAQLPIREKCVLLDSTCSKELVLKSSCATLKRMVTTPKFLVRRCMVVVVFYFTLILYVCNIHSGANNILCL